jgi:DNA polymerase-3 subunit beta
MLIPTHKLKAALLCAATKDVHFYLNGVRVECDGAGELLLIATDGYVEFVGRLAVESDAPAFALTIPRDAVKTACAARTSMLELKVAEGTHQLGVVVFEPIDGRYPEWRRVIPVQHDPDAHAHYDWALLERARAALAQWHKAKNCTATIVRQGPDDGPGVATAVDDTALVVIMPLRPERLVRPSPFI